MWRSLMLGVAFFATEVQAEVGVARRADCLLVVGGEKVIDGQCNFMPLDPDGSFMITGLNGKFFADVLIDAPGVASGYWNEQAYAGHAHSPLGTLYRENACWVNDGASVCAW